MVSCLCYITTEMEAERSREVLARERERCCREMLERKLKTKFGREIVESDVRQNKILIGEKVVQRRRKSGIREKRMKGLIHPKNLLFNLQGITSGQPWWSVVVVSEFKA